MACKAPLPGAAGQVTNTWLGPSLVPPHSILVFLPLLPLLRGLSVQTAKPCSPQPVPPQASRPKGTCGPRSP